MVLARARQGQGRLRSSKSFYGPGRVSSRGRARLQPPSMPSGGAGGRARRPGAKAGEAARMGAQASARRARYGGGPPRPPEQNLAARDAGQNKTPARRGTNACARVFHGGAQGRLHRREEPPRFQTRCPAPIPSALTIGGWRLSRGTCGPNSAISARTSSRRDRPPSAADEERAMVETSGASLSRRRAASALPRERAARCVRSGQPRVACATLRVEAAIDGVQGLWGDAPARWPGAWRRRAGRRGRVARIWSLRARAGRRPRAGRPLRRRCAGRHWRHREDASFG